MPTDAARAPLGFHFAARCRFYLGAVTRYQLHSTFLTGWVADTLEDRRHYYAFDAPDCGMDHRLLFRIAAAARPGSVLLLSQGEPGLWLSRALPYPNYVAVPPADLIWIDAQAPASAESRSTLLSQLPSEAIVVVHKPHASPAAEACWQGLCAHPAITQSVDYYRMGVLFLRPEWRTAQHWRLVRWQWKPWRIGLWGS
jgi:hypothetical protein